MHEYLNFDSEKNSKVPAIKENSLCIVISPTFLQNALYMYLLRMKLALCFWGRGWKSQKLTDGKTFVGQQRELKIDEIHPTYPEDIVDQ